MLKGNVRTALDFFIMYENEHPKMHEETDDPNLNVKYAELHLSKAICYKNLDGLKYVNNAIREYGEAGSLYLKALQNSSSCEKEWKRIYSRKLLRTSNDEISLFYKNQEYYRCIQACDKAIDGINILHNMKEDELRYNRIYCRLSKLLRMSAVSSRKTVFSAMKDFGSLAHPKPLFMSSRMRSLPPLRL